MSGSELGWFLFGALSASLSLLVMTIVQRSPGNSGRYPGSFLSYGAPGSTGFSGPTMDGSTIYYPLRSGQIVRMRDG